MFASEKANFPLGTSIVLEKGREAGGRGVQRRFEQGCVGDTSPSERSRADVPSNPPTHAHTHAHTYAPVVQKDEISALHPDGPLVPSSRAPSQSPKFTPSRPAMPCTPVRGIKATQTIKVASYSFTNSRRVVSTPLCPLLAPDSIHF